MKNLLLLFTLILFIQIQADATLPLNCFEYQYGGGRVQHKKYYNERFIEPYQWGNYQEKPIKEWYRDTMKYQRNQIKKDMEREGIIRFTPIDVHFF